MYTFSHFPTEKIRAGMTQKQEGSFKSGTKEFEDNLKAINLDPPAHLQQTHSDIILEANEPPIELKEGDALITQKKKLPLMVKVADCQGILIYDPQKEAIAAIHSGWKGSVQNIIGKTIQKMSKEFGSDPKALMIEVSPSLGPCCAEFSNPKVELPAFCHPFILDNNHVDFWQLTQKQCYDEGIKKENIHFAKICTKCDPDYFSYREGAEERMAVFIEMTNE